MGQHTTGRKPVHEPPYQLVCIAAFGWPNGFDRPLISITVCRAHKGGLPALGERNTIGL